MNATLTINRKSTIFYESPRISVHSIDAIVPNSKKELLNIIGGLSEPSKMPGYAYSLSAFRCNVGEKLSTVEGSTCFKCYARKGNYVRFPAVQIALERRYHSLFDSRWTAAFIALFRQNFLSETKWFRWHDSGDLQSYEHLLNIVNVVRNSPHMNFWMPTREYALVDRFRKEYGEFPENFAVRVSAHLLNKVAPSRFNLNSAVLGRNTTIEEFRANNSELYFSVCPAPNQDGECKNCRACWNFKFPTIVYKEH